MTKSAAGPRERLLESANNLFYRQGYRATGINQILKESSVAKASFYHHFRSKEDLLVTWLELRHVEMGGRIREHIDKGTTPTEKVRRIFQALEEFGASEKLDHG